ncbi:MAG: hypothetical protein KAR25_05760 [Methanosarcinales archaeon]|nr:hypothetical protein [Methanosarcinales archaeon]
MSYRPTDTSEKDFEVLIMAEMTGRTGSDTLPAGEVREYMPYSRSADMSAAQAGEGHWTGDFIFENEWQSFRAKKYQKLELKTSFHECNPGRYKIVAKVMHVFGNTTMRIIEVSV